MLLVDFGVLTPMVDKKKTRKKNIQAKNQLQKYLNVLPWMPGLNWRLE